MSGKTMSLMLLLAVLSAGCASPVPTIGASPPTVPPPTASQAPSSTAASTPTVTAPPPLDLSEPPVKAQLHASDPSSVQLANGQPTLVEFFAFW